MNTLGRRLAAALERAHAPGGVAAVWSDDEAEVAASGWANRDAKIEANADTLFPVGSITKAFTATLVMQLVDSGRIGLGTKIDALLPGFRRAAPVTIRQLLSHTSGIDGDLTTDFGRDADAVTRLVEAAGAVAQLHEPGAFFSYCNVGYIVLGHLLEVVHGAVWDEVLRTQLLKPLGLGHAITLPDDAMKHRVAMGEGGRPFFPRSNGPSGMVMAASAGDLIRFARMHLDGGVAEDGTRILSEAATHAMRTMAIGVPTGGRYHAWGLGWMLTGGEAFGHDGGVEGTSAFLRIWPLERRVVVLMVNRSSAVGVWRELSGEPAPEPPQASTLEIDPERYIGRYSRHGQMIDVAAGDRDLVARLHGAYAGDDMDFRLRPVTLHRFAIVAEGVPAVPAHFLPEGAGAPAYLFAGDRLFRREGAT